MACSIHANGSALERLDSQYPRLAELRRSRGANNASENAKSAAPGSANTKSHFVCRWAPQRNEPRSRLPGGLGIQIEVLADFCARPTDVKSLLELDRELITALGNCANGRKPARCAGNHVARRGCEKDGPVSFKTAPCRATASAAANFRARCGSGRSPPLCSSQGSRRLAPQVWHRTASF